MISRPLPSPHGAFSVAELVAYLNERRVQLFRAPVTKMGSKWTAEYSALLDEVMQRIYNGAWEAARAHWSPQQTVHVQTTEFVRAEAEPGLTLLAVGGYGRGEMCPYSDVDIVFVPAEEDHPVIDAVVKEAFRLVVEVLIDGAKLDVGYAYRPLADIERLDTISRCALLDARRLAGSEQLLARAQEKLLDSWDGVEMLLQKRRERRAMSEHLAYSLYSVSPNLKEGAGALRETQTALWTTSAVLKTTKPLCELIWRGVVSQKESDDALAARDWMLKLRTWLHLAEGRKSDVLNVEIQDRAAHALDYTGSGGFASQNLLRDYYRHGEAASRFSSKVMRRLAEGPLALDGHFTARNESLGLAYPFALQNHPELAMTPFVLAQRYGFSMEADLTRAIEAALPLFNDETRAHPIVRAGFMTLLSDPLLAPDALISLRAHGVLGAIMPEFKAMLHLAPSDPSHQLTVGEHSLYAVRTLGELWKQSASDDLLRAVWDGVDDLELLTLGILLHDVGKIALGTDHSVSGATIARAIGERLGLGTERLSRLSLLVRRHLLLPRAARLRDLSDPGSIREVVEQAQSVPNLKMLYLLSLCDTQAVGERTYTQRDLDAMRELYERALYAMTSQETAHTLSAQEAREARAQDERERVRREMRRQAWDDARLQELVDVLPAAYVLNTPLPEIAAELKFLEQLPTQGLVTDFYDDPRRSSTDLTLIAYDDAKPGLLSKVCGVIHAAGADILAAQAYTLRPRQIGALTNTEDSAALARADASGRENTSAVDGLGTNGSSYTSAPVVLDRLQVVANGRPLSESRAARLAVMLREALIEGMDVEDMLLKGKKPVAEAVMPTRIGVRNDLSDEHTVITVVCDNVPGLLYSLTRVLASLNLDIHSAKITTWAGHAEDAFYVTRRHPDGYNAKIEDEAIGPLLGELRTRLRRPKKVLALAGADTRQ